MSTLEKTIAEIKSLKIQGASLVARSAVEALGKEMLSSKATSRAAFLKQLHIAAIKLKNSRPTEPALRNALRFVLVRTKQCSGEPPQLKRVVEREVKEYEQNAFRTKKLIAEYGAKLVPDGGSVLTHCHSNTVMEVLRKAKASGKKFEVFCTESRPLYQGHKTTRDLTKAGIKTTLIVDSASQYALRMMRDTDVVMVGSDAITSRGDLINKIGTATIAIVAREHDKDLYSCTGVHKFDPLTLWGESEPIEMRDKTEILDSKTAKQKQIAYSKLKILNPAFDLTPARFVEAYVTELGVIPPQAMLNRVWKELDLDDTA